jgi:hypothetical protein
MKFNLVISQLFWYYINITNKTRDNMRQLSLIYNEHSIYTQLKFMTIFQMFIFMFDGKSNYRDAINYMTFKNAFILFVNYYGVDR